jgi:hypothetical protein
MVLQGRRPVFAFGVMFCGRISHLAWQQTCSSVQHGATYIPNSTLEECVETDRLQRVKGWIADVKRKAKLSCNSLWRSIGMRDVKAPTFSRQSANRWRWGCQPYAPAALYPQQDSWYSFLLEAGRPQGHIAVGRIRSTEKSNDLIGNRTGDLPVCSIVPQPTRLSRAPS